MIYLRTRKNQFTPIVRLCISPCITNICFFSSASMGWTTSYCINPLFLFIMSILSLTKWWSWASELIALAQLLLMRLTIAASVARDFLMWWFVGYRQSLLILLFPLQCKQWYEFVSGAFFSLPAGTTCDSQISKRCRMSAALLRHRFHLYVVFKDLKRLCVILKLAPHCSVGSVGELCCLHWVLMF